MESIFLIYRLIMKKIFINIFLMFLVSVLPEVHAKQEVFDEIIIRFKDDRVSVKSYTEVNKYKQTDPLILDEYIKNINNTQSFNTYNANVNNGLSLERSLLIRDTALVKLPYTMSLGELMVYIEDLKEQNEIIESISPNYKYKTTSLGYNENYITDKINRSSAFRRIDNGYSDYKYNIGNEIYHSGQWYLDSVMDICRDFNLCDENSINKQITNITSLNIPALWQTVSATDVLVAVVDTGVEPLGIFGDRLVGGYSSITEDTNDTSDPNGHGTGVASLIASDGDFLGVNFEARIQPIRVLNQYGSGDLASITDGLSWLLSDSNPYRNELKLVNMSLGSYIGRSGCNYSGFSIWRELIEDFNEKRIVLVAAAGNDNYGLNNYVPASCEGVITVMSLEKEGFLASYTNWRSDREDRLIAMPGGSGDKEIDRILLAGTDDDLYVRMHGTSFAAPLATGLFSLMLSVDDTLNFEEIVSIYSTHFTENVGYSEVLGYNQCPHYKWCVGPMDTLAVIETTKDKFISKEINRFTGNNLSEAEVQGIVSNLSEEEKEPILSPEMTDEDMAQILAFYRVKNLSSDVVMTDNEISELLSNMTNDEMLSISNYSLTDDEVHDLIMYYTANNTDENNISENKSGGFIYSEVLVILSVLLIIFRRYSKKRLLLKIKM